MLAFILDTNPSNSFFTKRISNEIYRYFLSGNMQPPPIFFAYASEVKKISWRQMTFSESWGTGSSRSFGQALRCAIDLSLNNDWKNPLQIILSCLGPPTDNYVKDLKRVDQLCNNGITNVNILMINRNDIIADNACSITIHDMNRKNKIDFSFFNNFLQRKHI